MTYKYPNVDLDTADVRYMSSNKPDGTPLDVVVDEQMAQLIDVLAVKHPLWLFKLAEVRKVDLYTAHTAWFRVYDNANPREQIGNIATRRRYTSNGGSEFVYSIGNKRISSNRERGDTVDTKNVKVAIKTVDKYFTPPPWDERLDEAYDACRHIIHYAQAQATRQLRAADENMHEVIDKFVIDNWDLFLASLNPAQIALATERMELDKTHKEMQKLHQHAVAHTNILTVIIEGDKYVVQSRAGTNSYTSEQLTDEVRMKIGMLKLTNEREVLPTIGAKNKLGFVIMLDQQEGV